ncbi:MAG: hypothetical protein MSG64_02650 [Pyrinomonadaceae bacterium MAG19_C2-C3]|nr:hypothetical protein [Pyrinomonadaceae bacterium MAG19_C2-C3]
MSGKNKEATQRLLAIIVIIAMMMTMGIPMPVIVFFAFVIYFVWKAVQHTERQEVERIFDFYIAASEILRDDERRWFGFEISKVTRDGESILHELRDPPPLVHFALGALAYRAGDYAVAAERLAHIVETDDGNETRRMTASPELHRYVQVLRNLEREPARGPQTMAAIRSLERARSARSAQMLEESRAKLNEASIAAASTQQKLFAHEANPHEANAKTKTSTPATTPILPPNNVSFFDDANRNSSDAPDASDAARFNPRPSITANEQTASDNRPSAPPPITEVLRDLYDEEKKTA